MTSLNGFWNELTRNAKIGMVTGIIAIAALILGLAVWSYRTNYQVLFADLATTDAAAMTAELDRMKIPYQLSDNGNTILVAGDLVHKTRLKLMSKDIPLHGAVGFEVFNNVDFGMTEFLQKVNYQRAVQGELTRTILSIDGIQSARVHLAIPEQGLFKKTLAKPKASVAIVTKPGKSLSAEQVTGIQRLVAASVPEVVAADVMILDQHGVALTRVASIDEGTDSGATQLDSKRGAEEYLTRKVTKILDSTFGQGEAIATVDVSLNLDQSKVTTEEILPAKHPTTENSPAGVVVRERQTVRGNAGGSGASAASTATQDTQSSAITSTESDYQVGRRVEQVVVAPGTTRRLTIAVVVKQSLTEAQIDKLREVVSLAVGLNSQRGDAVVVYSMDKLASAITDITMLARTDVLGKVSGNGSVTQETATEQRVLSRASRSPTAEFVARFSVLEIWEILGSIFVFSLAALILLRSRRRQASVHKKLSQSERDALLANVRRWVDGGRASSVAAGEHS